MSRGETPLIQGRSRVWRPAIGLLLLAVGLSACHAAPADPTSSPPTQASHPAASSPPPATPPAGILWLAVLRTASSPEGLDAATARLAPALGGALMVAPATCFPGLPHGIDGYILGVVASSRAELDPLVADAGIAPTLQVRTRSVCVD